MLHRNLSPEQIKSKNAQYNKTRISAPQYNPVPFEIKLASNPFLKQQQKYQYILHQLKQYNKAILKNSITDNYHIKVYQKLFTAFAMLGTMNNRQIQIQRLDQIVQWYNKQLKLIQQRKDQGVIRYKVLKKDINNEKSNLSQNYSTQKTPVNNLHLPSELIAKQALPFKKKWRTAHKQLQVPENRLKQYKRKQLSVGPFLDDSQKNSKKAPRITYPKLQKIKWARDDFLDQLNDAEKQLNGDNPVQNPEANPEQNKPAGEDGQKKNQGQDQKQPEVDLGLGQPPQQGEPQEQEEQVQQDKLAPRLKPYTFQPKQFTLEDKLKSQSMQKQYLKIQQKNTKKKIEQQNLLNLMHSWAIKKTQLNRQIDRRIQNMGVSMRYQLSYEQPEPIERINPQDEKKLGFSALYQTQIVKKPTVDLSGDFQLPKINNKSQIYEKSIRKDRLKSLKKKFGTLLSLKQTERRDDAAGSMCQYEFKRKGFSEVLRKHSKSKQRLKQLDQVFYLKQKLAKGRTNIDIRSLSLGLAVPEDEDNLPEESILSKDLLSNPYWVQPKKKKKKK